MTSIPSNEAGETLGALIAQVSQSHEPIQIRGGEGNAVLVSEEDWRAIQETMYLLSAPNMAASIRDGLNSPAGQCSREPD